MPRVAKRVPILSLGDGASVYSGPIGKQAKLTFQPVSGGHTQTRPYTGPARIQKRSIAAEQQDEHFDGPNGQPWESCDLGIDAQQTADRETAASRRQRARIQQDQLWRERQPEHRFRRYCRLASEGERRQALQHQLQADFSDRLATLIPFCQQCQAPFQLISPAAPITFAGINGYVTVDNPDFQCSCGKRVAVHPISLDCFPATPSRPEVWYDNQLLALTAAAQHAGPLAIQAHSTALKQLYSFNGLDPARPAVWDNLGMAAQQWPRVEVEVAKAQDCDLPAILPDQPDAWQSCPCCWQTCQAAVGDACLGITHLRSAASNMHSIQPFYQGPFISDEAVQHMLEQQRNLPADLWQHVSCVDFKAVGTLGRRAGVLDVLGMAALVCRHEFTMVACNLFTEENFSYYDLMLSQVLKQYTEGNGRRLVCFFLDIACQFKPYWDRLHAAEDAPRMAIGPWHARVHKAACQRQFAARQTPESGLTFGDNIEHLWAPLRKQAHLLKYMSRARRQDHLTSLMWYLEAEKERKLSNTLQRWHDAAKLKKAQYSTQLDTLQQQAADMAEDMAGDAPLQESGAHQGLHVPLDKLQWQHQYQECLEKVFLLTSMLDNGTAQQLEHTGIAASLSEHQYRQTLAEVTDKARRLEQRYHVPEAWTQQHPEYQQAAVERKCFWVHRLHNSIAADIDRLHVMTLSAQRTSRQHRGTSSSYKVRIRATHKAIDKSILQLQHWHEVSGDIGHIAYEPAALSRATIEEQGWALPWLTGQQSESAMQHRITDAQQRMQRCEEEQSIVVREVTDAITFYEHQLHGVQTAIRSRQAADFVPTGQNISVFCNGAPEAMLECYVAGQLHVLHEREKHCQHLLSQMQSVSSYLTSESPAEPLLPELHDFSASDDEMSMPDAVRELIEADEDHEITQDGVELLVDILNMVDAGF